MLIKIKNKKQNKFIISERLYIGITDIINGFRSTLACCEVMEMQEILWPIKRLRTKDFAIDMLFEYEDNDGSTLVWCQGRVVAFIKESIDKHVYVKIEWSDKCVRDGDLKITRNQLKKTKWNPNVPVGGAWREDLYHKLMHKG